MPLFEFRCAACGIEFEELVRGTERVACPRCDDDQPEKLFSASAAHVRGGSLPVTSACPPSDAPPCSPHCCRLP